MYIYTHLDSSNRIRAYSTAVIFFFLLPSRLESFPRPFRRRSPLSAHPVVVRRCTEALRCTCACTVPSLPPTPTTTTVVFISVSKLVAEDRPIVRNSIKNNSESNIKYCTYATRVHKKKNIMNIGYVVYRTDTIKLL